MKFINHWLSTTEFHILSFYLNLDAFKLKGIRLVILGLGFDWGDTK